MAAATTAVSGCTRLAHSMGEHGMLPREFGRLERRTLVSREAILSTGAIAVVIVIVTAVGKRDDVAFLASTYSFGVLLAFTAAQLAVIRLRSREPDLPRPYRAWPDVRIRGVLVPLPALVDAVHLRVALAHPARRRCRRRAEHHAKPRRVRKRDRRVEPGEVEASFLGLEVRPAELGQVREREAEGRHALQVARPLRTRPLLGIVEHPDAHRIGLPQQRRTLQARLRGSGGWRDVA
jgi:hypothetical protein